MWECNTVKSHSVCPSVCLSLVVHTWTVQYIEIYFTQYDRAMFVVFMPNWPQKRATSSVAKLLVYTGARVVLIILIWLVEWITSMPIFRNRLAPSDSCSLPSCGHTALLYVDYQHATRGSCSRLLDAMLCRLKSILIKRRPERTQACALSSVWSLNVKVED